jgi:hypothetical protein
LGVAATAPFAEGMEPPDVGGAGLLIYENKAIYKSYFIVSIYIGFFGN